MVEIYRECGFNKLFITTCCSDVATGAFRIEVDDVDVTGTISVDTGGCKSDKTSTVSLSSGQQVIKHFIESGLFNINHFDITYNGPPPAAPTGLQVDSTGVNSVSLSWTAPAGSPIGYNVKRSATSNGPYTTVGSTIDGHVRHAHPGPRRTHRPGSHRGCNQVALSWAAPIGSPTSYNVKRSTTSGSAMWTSPRPARTTTNYTDTTANGTTYYYVVLR